MKKDARPVFLNLLQIKFPITAIISIGHRISGIVLFLSLPIWLFFLQETVGSQEKFVLLQECLASSSTKIFLFLSILATCYHVLAGIRHLIMDFGFCESFKAAKITAFFVLGFTALSALFLWVKIL